MLHLVVDVDPLRRLLQGDGIRLRRLQQHAPAVFALRKSGVVRWSVMVDLPQQSHQPQACVQSAALMHGSSYFETMRSRQRQILRAVEHRKRY